MMDPALTYCPADLLTPSRFDTLSRPFFADPPDFL